LKQRASPLADPSMTRALIFLGERVPRAEARGYWQRPGCGRGRTNRYRAV